jgi:PBSX family phage terminase large subunit
MRLNPRQKQAVRDTTARLNVLEGSVRSGKSVALDWRFIKAVGESKKGLPPDAVDIMVGKTLGSLRRNVINPIIELVGQEDAEYFPGKQELNLFGETVYCFGASDERAEGKIRGASVRKSLGDEITLWPESFFRMMDSRLSFDSSQFFGSTNPGPPNHYLKRDYLDRRHELDVKVMKFLLHHNKALSPRYVEAISKNYTGLWYRRFILGEWCLAEGAIYDFYDDALHTMLYTPTAKYHVLGCDYGTGNATVFLLFGVNPLTHPRVWLEREYVWDSRARGRQKTDGEYSTDLRQFLADAGVVPRVVVVDPSAASFILQLRRDGVTGVKLAKNDVVDGIRTQATLLKNGDYRIHRRCTRTRQDYGGYVWDLKKQERGEDAPMKVGDSDHSKDAERYVLHTLFNHKINYNKLFGT